VQVLKVVFIPGEIDVAGRSIVKKSSSDIANDHLQGLVRLWYEIRGKREVPLKKELKPERLLPWLGNLSIIEKNDTDGYWLRLVGVNLAETFGQDPTGQSFNDIVDSQYQDRINAVFDLAMSANTPIYQRGSFWEIPDRERSFNRLLLPMSVDGKNTTHLLVAVYFDRTDNFEISLDSMWPALSVASAIEIKL
jgi:hypothetical protein